MICCSASDPSLVDGEEEGLLREGGSFPAQGLLVTLGLPVWGMPMVNDTYQQTDILASVHGLGRGVVTLGLCSGA